MSPVPRLKGHWGRRWAQVQLVGPEAYVARKGKELRSQSHSGPGQWEDTARALFFLRWEARAGFKQGRDFCFSIITAFLESLGELFRCCSTTAPIRPVTSERVGAYGSQVEKGWAPAATRCGVRSDSDRNGATSHKQEGRAVVYLMFLLLSPNAAHI